MRFADVFPTSFNGQNGVFLYSRSTTDGSYALLTRQAADGSYTGNTITVEQVSGSNGTKVLAHPGIVFDSVIQFSIAGVVQVRGSLRHEGPAGNGVIFYIYFGRQNFASPAFSQFLAPGTSLPSFALDVPAQYSNDVNLAVNDNGEVSYDWATWTNIELVLSRGMVISVRVVSVLTRFHRGCDRLYFFEHFIFR